MRKSYTFYGLFGSSSVWQLPTEELTVSAHGIQWPKSTPCDVPPDPREVEICRTFLARCERVAHPQRGSYGFKHVIQSWAGEYVSNGALIRAALDLGIECVVQRGNPNAILAVGKRSVKLALATPPGPITVPHGATDSYGRPWRVEP